MTTTNTNQSLISITDMLTGEESFLTQEDVLKKIETWKHISRQMWKNDAAPGNEEEEEEEEERHAQGHVVLVFKYHIFTHDTNDFFLADTPEVLSEAITLYQQEVADYGCARLYIEAQVYDTDGEWVKDYLEDSILSYGDYPW